MSRSRSSLLACLAILAAVAGVGCSNQSGVTAAQPDTRAADEATIRAKDGIYADGVAAKDAERIVALYEDGAVLFAPKAPASIGKDAIRQAFGGLLKAPGVKMAFKTSSVDVSRSGDLAMQRATFQIETTDKDGKPSTETGQAVMVWRKQADGSWKVIADTNADDK